MNQMDLVAGYAWNLLGLLVRPNHPYRDASARMMARTLEINRKAGIGAAKVAARRALETLPGILEFRRQYGFYPPNLATIDTTKDCSLACVGCLTEGLREGQSGPISAENLEAIMRQTDRFTFGYSFMGAEPLTEPSKTMILEKVMENPNTPFVYFTSGKGFDSRMIDAMALNWNLLPVISINGLEIFHDATRKTKAGNGSFHYADSAIKRLSSINSPYLTSSVVFASNWEHLCGKEFLEYLADNKVIEAIFFPFSPLSNGKYEGQMLPIKERDEFTRRLFSRRLPYVVTDYASPSSYEKGSFHCKAGTTMFYYTFDKDQRVHVTPCFALPISLGTITDQRSISDIITSDIARTIRNLPHGRCIAQTYPRELLRLAQAHGCEIIGNGVQNLACLEDDAFFVQNYK